MGVFRGCGAYTRPRNGKGDAYAYCKRCHPDAIRQKWTPELVISAMLEWRQRYGRLPSSYDSSRTHAQRREGEALDRLSGRVWPSASVVSDVYGSWKAARAAAAKQLVEARDEGRRSIAGSSFVKLGAASLDRQSPSNGDHPSGPCCANRDSGPETLYLEPRAGHADGENKI